MRVVRVIYNQWSSESITVLCGGMGMVPECTRLIMCVKLMQKAFVWFYGALSDTRNTISPVGLSLGYSMPVLP